MKLFDNVLKVDKSMCTVEIYLYKGKFRFSGCFDM